MLQSCCAQRTFPAGKPQIKTILCFLPGQEGFLSPQWASKYVTEVVPFALAPATGIAGR